MMSLSSGSGSEGLSDSDTPELDMKAWTASGNETPQTGPQPGPKSQKTMATAGPALSDLLKGHPRRGGANETSEVASRKASSRKSCIEETRKF